MNRQDAKAPRKMVLFYLGELGALAVKIELMQTNQNETEIKLPISDLEQTINQVRKLDVKILTERHLEDNFLFDQKEGFLKKERMLLRLRIIAAAEPPSKEWKAVLTFKG